MSWRSSQYPTLKVSIAFTTSNPMTASPTWTEVTADVRSLRTRRGRSDETQRFQPGTATVVLDNADRKYDPQYGSSAYTGNLYPMRQLKVEAIWNSTTYPVFRGFIEGWPQDYHESNKDATVTLTANDAFEYFANCEMPDASGLFAKLGTVSFWYPLDDDNTGELYNTAVDLTYGQHGAYYYDDITQTVDFRQPALVSEGGSVHLAGGAHVKLSSATYSVLLSPKVYTLGVSFTCNGSPAGAAPLIDASGDWGAASTRVTVTTSGVIGFDVAAGVASASITGTIPVADGKPHGVVVTRNGTALALYVDGVADGTATMGANSLGAGSYIQLGNYITTYDSGTLSYASGVTHFTGNLQNFVAYASALSSTNAGTLSGWLGAWGEEGSGARIGHILDLADWPSGMRSLDTGDVIVGRQSLRGSALSETQLVEVSEDGRLFVDRSGNVAFHSRTRDVTSAAPTYTFGATDSSTAAQILGGTLSFRWDRNLISTQVTVNGIAAQQTSTSSTSSVYGYRNRSITTLLTNANDCRDLAEGLLNVRYMSDAQLRTDGFTVRPARAPSTAWPIVLGLELGDKVTLSRTPQGTGSAISLNLSVASIEHALDDNGDWSVKFNGTPYDWGSLFSTAWVLGTGALGSTTRLHY